MAQVAPKLPSMWVAETASVGWLAVIRLDAARRRGSIATSLLERARFDHFVLTFATVRRPPPAPPDDRQRQFLPPGRDWLSPVAKGFCRAAESRRRSLLLFPEMHLGDQLGNRVIPRPDQRAFPIPYRTRPNLGNNFRRILALLLRRKLLGRTRANASSDSPFSYIRRQLWQNRSELMQEAEI